MNGKRRPRPRGVHGNILGRIAHYYATRMWLNGEAKMAKHMLEILYVQPKDGISKKSGGEYHLRLAQCVVHMPTGEKLIGELSLPRELAETEPGRYIGEFEIAIDREKRIGSRLVALVRMNPEIRANAAAQVGK